MGILSCLASVGQYLFVWFLLYLYPPNGGCSIYSLPSLSRGPSSCIEVLFTMAYIYSFRDVVSERIEELFDDTKTNAEIELLVAQAEHACSEAWCSWLEEVTSNS